MKNTKGAFAMGFLFDYEEFRRRQQRGLDRLGEEDFDEEFADEPGIFDDDYDDDLNDGGFSE